MRISLQKGNTLPDLPVRHTNIVEKACPDNISHIRPRIVFFLIKEKRILRNLQRVAGDIRPLVVKDLPALPETL
jgi:hypothetical protein